MTPEVACFDAAAELHADRRGHVRSVLPDAAAAAVGRSARSTRRARSRAIRSRAGQLPEDGHATPARSNRPGTRQRRPTSARRGWSASSTRALRRHRRCYQFCRATATARTRRATRDVGARRTSRSATSRSSTPAFRCRAPTTPDAAGDQRIACYISSTRPDARRSATVQFAPVPAERRLHALARVHPRARLRRPNGTGTKPICTRVCRLTDNGCNDLHRLTLSGAATRTSAFRRAVSNPTTGFASDVMATGRNWAGWRGRAPSLAICWRQRRLLQAEDRRRRPALRRRRPLPGRISLAPPTARASKAARRSASRRRLTSTPICTPDPGNDCDPICQSRCHCGRCTLIGNEARPACRRAPRNAATSARRARTIARPGTCACTDCDGTIGRCYRFCGKGSVRHNELCDDGQACDVARERR